MSSDYSDQYDSSDTGEFNESKRVYTQRSVWKDDPELKSWMNEDNGETSCKLCKVTLSGSSKKDLHRHAQSNKHKRHELREANGIGEQNTEESDADKTNEAAVNESIGDNPSYKFRSCWAFVEELQPWLVAGAGNCPYCKVCNRSLKALSRKDLFRHMKSVKHKRNMSTFQKVDDEIDYEIENIETSASASHVEFTENSIPESLTVVNDGDNVVVNLDFSHLAAQPSSSPPKILSRFKHPDIRDWAVERTKEIAHCKWCKVNLRIGAGKKGLREHAATQKHKMSQRLYKVENTTMLEESYNEGDTESFSEPKGGKKSPKIKKERIEKVAISEKKPSNRPSEYKPWKLDEELNTWAVKHQPGVAFCKVCQIYLRVSSGKNDLLRHKVSKKHQQNDRYMVREMCRICLKESDVKYMPSIFDKDLYVDMEISRKLFICGGVQIVQNGNEPDKICRKCVDKLDESYNFRKLCKKAEKYFESEFNKSNTFVLDSIETKPESTEAFDVIVSEPCVSSEGFDLKVEGETMDIENYDMDIEFDSAVQVEYLEGETPAELEAMLMEEMPMEEEEEDKKTYDFLPIRDVKPVLPPDPTFICEVCGNTYNKMHKLKNHMVVHTNERKYECEICKKRFTQSSTLKTHIRVHTGERPFMCKYCPRRFPDYGTRIRHEMVHRNERPFVCKTCGRAFTYSGSLKKHQLIHTGQKDYHCIPCGKSFPQAHNLKAHLGTIIHREMVAKLGIEYIN